MNQNKVFFSHAASVGCFATIRRETTNIIVYHRGEESPRSSPGSIFTEFVDHSEEFTRGPEEEGTELLTF